MKEIFKMKFDVIKIDVIIVVLLVVVDQLVKALVYNSLRWRGSVSLVRGLLSLTYVENTGAAFGLGFNSMSILILVSIAILLSLIGMVVYKKQELDKVTMLRFIFNSCRWNREFN